ncbi:MAG: DUF4258 domain-containing protein [Candidatus Bathyarchaeaceae archaeon]
MGGGVSNGLCVGGVEFTDHAMRKFKILKRLGFSVSMERVVRVVESPEKVDVGWKGRFIASAKLNMEHVLRVVYEKVGDKKLVVTFYPARRRRYEG